MIYPWQQAQWAQIWAMRQQQRLPHALMLLGEVGLGIDVFAKTLAQAVLCESDQEHACGECSGCRWYLGGNHPDYFQITPSETSGIIKIESIRELSQALIHQSARGGYQVVFIEQADGMNAASANALLKTLEEPAGDVLFLLWVKRVESLPLTVVSRTQRIAFTGSDNAATKSWLEQNVGVADDKPWLRVAQNRPLAVAALKDDEYFCWRDQLLQEMGSVRQGLRDPLVVCDKFSDWDGLVLVETFAGIVADGIRMQLNAPEGRLMHVDQVKTIEQLFAGLALQQLFELYDQMSEISRWYRLPQAINKGLLELQVWLRWRELTVR